VRGFEKRDACGGFANDELGGEPNGVGEGLVGILDAFDEDLGGCGSHLAEGLADGGETRVGVFGDEDVVEADDGDVARAGEADVFDGAYGPDGGGVVETEDGGEVEGAAEKLADGWIAELGRPGVFLEVDAELGDDVDADLLRDGVDGLPAGFGVEREGLALHEGDAPMPEIVEVLECEAGGAVVVEHEVGDAGNADVRGDSDGWKRNALAEIGVDEKEAIDGAADEKVRIFFDEIGMAEMTDGEVEITGLQEIFFNTEHESGEVAFAELGDDDADGVGEAGSEHAGVHIGPVLKFFGGVENALASLWRDGLGDGRVIEDDGDGGRREIEILSEDLEGNGLVCVRKLFSSGCHEAPELRGKNATVLHCRGCCME
jgi:hypothetical protein